MAYRVTQRIISSDDLLYPYFDDLCRKSKLLYNAALFRVRNIFTGYDKEHRTEKSKSFKKLRYYNDLIQTCTSAE
mgnify:CR=1 FL=1